MCKKHFDQYHRDNIIQNRIIKRNVLSLQSQDRQQEALEDIKNFKIKKKAIKNSFRRNKMMRLSLQKAASQYMTGLQLEGSDIQVGKIPKFTPHRVRAEIKKRLKIARKLEIENRAKSVTGFPQKNRQKGGFAREKNPKILKNLRSKTVDFVTTKPQKTEKKSKTARNSQLMKEIQDFETSKSQILELKNFTRKTNLTINENPENCENPVEVLALALKNMEHPIKSISQKFEKSQKFENSGKTENLEKIVVNSIDTLEQLNREMQPGSGRRQKDATFDTSRSKSEISKNRKILVKKSKKKINLGRTESIVKKYYGSRSIYRNNGLKKSTRSDFRNQ
jgi:hypothetical protein